VVLLLFFSVQIDATVGDETDLFTEQDVLKLELQVDLTKLCRTENQSPCKDVPAILTYHLVSGTTQQLNVHVRARGQWRKKRTNCRVPPLFVLFNDGTEGTIFEGQHVLPLNTHCRNLSRYENYVLKEYLAYRIYNLLTEKSVRTRLVNISYTNKSTSRRVESHWAFLAEHFDSMAKRNDAKVLKTRKLDLNAVEPQDMATMDLFQFMIGHTDWSALYLHNVVLIHQLEDPPFTGVTAVPFDFDFSGLVYTSYAEPAMKLRLKNVRQRLYRGFCNREIDWEKLFASFQGIRLGVFEMIDTLPGLSTGSRRQARAYLRGFYDILDSPRRRERLIIKACRERADVYEISGHFRSMANLASRAAS
jgi:hypothetical protein